MSRKVLIPLIIIVALFQLVAIGGKIFKMEDALATGELHLFKTAPVDPYDPYRGRYVALGQDNLNITYDPEKHPGLTRGSKVMIAVEKDEEGFSHFAGLAQDIHRGTVIEARIGWISNAKTINLRPPFSRFYMNEKEAPRAERVYRQNNTPEKRNAHIAVRIKEGVGVIEDLYIEGKPIDKYLEEDQEKDG